MVLGTLESDPHIPQDSTYLRGTIDIYLRDKLHSSQVSKACVRNLESPAEVCEKKWGSYYLDVRFWCKV